MDPNTAVALLGVLYKITCILVGLAFGYMGYRLFLADKVKAAGDVQFEHEKLKVKIGRAAPGTFFSLCGALIIAFTISRGIEFEQKTSHPPPGRGALLPEKPPFEADTSKGTAK